MPAYRCDSIAEMMQMYISYSTHATATNVTIVHKPLGVKNPFPKFFSECVDVDGQVIENPRPQELSK